MPAIGSAAQHGNTLKTGGQQRRRGLGGAAIGLADHHDPAAAGGKLRGSMRQISQRQIDGARQMTGRRSELLRLTNIDQHGSIAGCETTLQFIALDPCRRSFTRPAEQTGQESDHGEDFGTTRLLTRLAEGLPNRLQLRPNCEYCDKDLPPHATDARICSFECTFCAHCVESMLSNVCPNCGGGFEPRPIRPVTARRPGAFLGNHPASTERVRLKWDRAELAEFVQTVRDTKPEDR